MGIGNGTRAAHLDSEKVLQVQLDTANETIRRLTAILAAVLIDHHRGRALVESASVDAMYGEPQQSNGFMVDCATLHPLGQHRVQVVQPNGERYEPAKAAATELEAVPTAICGGDWHRNGSGVRCPNCGSKERIA